MAWQYLARGMTGYLSELVLLVSGPRKSGCRLAVIDWQSAIASVFRYRQRGDIEGAGIATPAVFRPAEIWPADRCATATPKYKF